MNELIDVEFEFCDPKEPHFQGCKALLNQLFAGESIDTSSLADNFITSSQVGSVVMVDGNLDPYALIALFSHQSLMSTGVLEMLRKKAIKQNSNAEMADSAKAFAKLLNESLAGTTKIGLLVNERLINMPCQLAPPLFKTLTEEVEWAVEDGKLEYSPDYLVYISKTFRQVKSTIDDEITENEENNQNSNHEEDDNNENNNHDEVTLTNFIDNNEGIVTNSNDCLESSKSNLETNSNDYNEESRPSKKLKTSMEQESLVQEMNYFQQEDEAFEDLCEYFIDYKTRKQASSDARRLFNEHGIETYRRIFVIRHGQFEQMFERIKMIVEQ